VGIIDPLDGDAHLHMGSPGLIDDGQPAAGGLDTSPVGGQSDVSFG
jgi:hypothetical protein